MNFAILNQYLTKNRQEKKAEAFDASAYIRSVNEKFSVVDSYFVEDPQPLLATANEIADGLVVEGIEMDTDTWDILQSL